MKVDPYILAVVRGGLQQVVDEMDTVMVRAALSPVISEGTDCASGIYRETGELVVQGTSSLPVFIETMQDAVRTVHETALRKGGAQEGDIFLMNLPYRGGTHLPDVKVFKPYFRKGKLFFWLANTGHWVDIGGAVPGGFNFKATEIYQEGLQMPPLKIYDKGELNEELLTLILANVRNAEERYGDFKAQVGGLNVGSQRVNALLDKYGDNIIITCIEELEKRAEMYMRSFIAELPDGKYSATDYMDNDGVEDTPLKIAVDILVNGDEMTIDFSNSNLPVKGPVNCPYSCTKSAVFTCLKHALPDMPISGGAFKPVKIIIPERSMLNASFPSPVAAAAAEISHNVANTVNLALAQVVPEKMWGCSFGTINNCPVGGWDPERGEWVLLFYLGGGYGGWSGGDGLSYGPPPVGISRTPTLEVYEQWYPVRIRKFALNEGSAGAGKWRGGFGAVLEVEFVGEGEARLNLLGDKGKFAPRGILGGRDARKNKFHVRRRSGEEVTFPVMISKGEIILKKGDVFIFETPGGAGYGNPRERERKLIIWDIANGRIDKETAEKEYGILIDQKELGEAMSGRWEIEFPHITSLQPK